MHLRNADDFQDCPLFISKELEERVLTMQNKVRHQGLDGIPTQVYKQVLHQWAELLLEASKACLKERIFPVTCEKCPPPPP